MKGFMKEKWQELTGRKKKRRAPSALVDNGGEPHPEKKKFLDKDSKLGQFVRWHMGAEIVPPANLVVRERGHSACCVRRGHEFEQVVRNYFVSVEIVFAAWLSIPFHGASTDVISIPVHGTNTDVARKRSSRKFGSRLTPRRSLPPRRPRSRRSQRRPARGVNGKQEALRRRKRTCRKPSSSLAAQAPF
jgi:hypothetical protein